MQCSTKLSGSVHGAASLEAVSYTSMHCVNVLPSSHTLLRGGKMGHCLSLNDALQHTRSRVNVNSTGSISHAAVGEPEIYDCTVHKHCSVSFDTSTLHGAAQTGYHIGLFPQPWCTQGVVFSQHCHHAEVHTNTAATDKADGHLATMLCSTLQ